MPGAQGRLKPYKDTILLDPIISSKIAKHQFEITVYIENKPAGTFIVREENNVPN